MTGKSNISFDSKRVLYLSGAPRLSTSPATESLGPRSHILGVIEGLGESGFMVDSYIAGDHVPSKMHASGSEKRMTTGRLPKLRLWAVDQLRKHYARKSQRAARKMLANQSYDFAYERYALFQSLGSEAKKKGVPWVLEVNALLAMESTSDRKATLSREAAREAEAKAFNDADYLVVVSQALSMLVQSEYGIAAEKIIVIPNGVSVRAPSQTAHPSHDVPSRIGFLGTLYPWQNVDLLIQALASPEQQGLSLSVAGGGPVLDLLKSLVDERNLSDRVEFLGAIAPDQVGAFLDSVDICFSGHAGSSTSYFSPLKLWEYLGAGKIVVINSQELVAELIEDGYPIVSYEHMEPGSILAALNEAIDEYPRLKRLAMAAPSKISRDHSWAARVNDLLSEIGE